MNYSFVSSLEDWRLNMTNILITGISGNVGSAVAKYLDTINIPYIAGVRDPLKYKKAVALDFENPSTYDNALKGIDSLFLVRPPRLTDIKGIFEPFINACVKNGVKHIVFLSLLGIENNPFPPHYRIEKCIKASGIPHTFIRPSFFMQNLTGQHLEDIVQTNQLFIPCGNAKVSFIDTDDIGEIIGKSLINDLADNHYYTLTGPKAIDYYEVARVMTKVLGRPITYTKPSLWHFRKVMLERGTPKAFVNVMVALYFTTMMGMAKSVTNTAETLLGRPPHDIEIFIQNNQALFNPST